MTDSIRPYVTTGVAIVGAGLLLTTPVSAPPIPPGTSQLAGTRVALAPNTVPDKVPIAGG